MRARYLLRFDDICPSMNWHAWNAVERILLDHQLNPILGVIPDNRDNTLRVCASNGRFWDHVRAWQARGWTIAMHGWQHRFVTKDGGILRLNPYSEFAGLPRREQEIKIRSGLNVFEREGIRSVTWIAPAHSFDEVTLRILNESGFRYVSDGFFLLPHIDRFGITWIPQQLWSFRWRAYGVWTICFHINSWAVTEILGFEESIRKYAAKISDFEAVLHQYGRRRENVFDSAAAAAYRSAARAKRAMKRLASI
jgi:predicted deacetylase